MADISKMAVQVTASAATLNADMAKADALFNTGAQRMQRSAQKSGEAIAKSLYSPAVAAAGQIFSPLESFAERAYMNPLKAGNDLILGGAASLLAKAPVIGGLIAAPLQAVHDGLTFAVDTYISGAERIRSMGKAAMKASMPVEQFQVISQLVGTGELAERAMFKFAQKLTEAASASVGTRTEFDKLGLDGRKLAELYNTDAVAAFGQVADKIRELPGPAMRGAAAFHLFGKQGKEAMIAIMRGSEGLEMTRKNIEKFGLGITDSVVESVRHIDRVARQIDMLKQGFSNQVVLAVAPVMHAVAEMIGELPAGFGGFADTLLAGLERVGAVVSSLIDNFGDMDAMGAQFEPLWDRFRALALDAVEMIGDAFEKMLDTKLKPPAWLTLIDPRGLAGGLAGSPRVGSITGAPGPAELSAEDYRLKAEFAEMELQMKRDWAIATGNAPAQGAWDRFMDRVRELKDATKPDGKPDFISAIYDRVNKLIDTTKGPFGHFLDEMNEVQHVLAQITRQGESGLKDRLLNNSAELAGYAAFQKLRSAFPDQQKFAGAAVEGSSEAYSALVAFQNGAQTVNVQEEMKRILLEQAVQQREQIRIGLEANRLFGGLNVRTRGY